jgi:multidrug transporter EmrE-like cation transporter
MLSSIVLPTPVTILLLSLGAAVFYTGSMIAMKMWAHGPTVLIGAVMLITIAVAVVFEIYALKSERLGMIYVSILAVEVVLIAGVSVFLFGESFSVREGAGCLLVICGTALAWA